MLSKLTDTPPDLIFIDTRYHFQETLDLKDAVQKRYGVRVHVYGPQGAANAQEVEAKYGEKPWEVNEDLYDYIVKASNSFNLTLPVKSTLISLPTRLSRLNAHTVSWG